MSFEPDILPGMTDDELKEHAADVEEELKKRGLPFDSEHIVEFRRDGWGLSHPAHCRREGSLLDCEYNKAMSRFVEDVGEGGPPLKLGRYLVTGILEGEPIFEAVDG